MVSEAHLAEAIRRIESVICPDRGSRGLAGFTSTSDLLAAARSLLAGKRTILTTGFCIRPAMIGETDGPSGALALANALRQLGHDVVLVTDKYSSDLLHAGSALFGAPFRTTILSPRQDEADRAILSLLTKFSPTHVLAVERPGSAADGHRYSMRGEMLDELVPAADLLREALKEK